MNIFTVLIARFVAWALVTYVGMSVDWAVALTSDPELLGLINAGVAAGVVAVSEEISKRLGSPVAKLVVSLAEKYAGKYAAKFVIPKADDAPKR